MALMTNPTFVGEIRGYGIEIPDNCTGIRILLDANQPARILFYIKDPLETFPKSQYGKFQKEISSKDFYEKLATKIRLPDYTSFLHIIAELDNIVTMYIQAPLPQNALSFLNE